MGTQTTSYPPPSRMRLRPSLLLKQTAFVALMTIITGGTLILAAGTFARRMVRTEIDQRLMLAATDRQTLLQMYVRHQLELVAQVASRTRLRQLIEDHTAAKIAPAEFQRQSRQILDDARHSAGGFLDISIANLRGIVITSTDTASLGKNFGADPDFREGSQRPHLGVPRRVGDRRQSFLTAPVVSSGGKSEGVVLVALDVRAMGQLLTPQTGLGESGEVLVGTREDSQIHLLLPASGDPQLTEISLDSMTPMAAAIRGERGLVRAQDYRGVEVLAAYRPVGYSDWGLVAKINAEEADAPLTRFRAIIVLLEIATVLAGLVLSYFLARQSTQPILALANQATMLGTGDLTARTGLARRADEFGDLAKAFDTMADQIQRHVQRAEALSDTSALFARVTRDSATLLTDVARRVAELVGDTCIVLLASADGMWLEPLALHDVDREILFLVRSVLAAAPVRADNSTLSGKVFASGEPLLLSTVSVSEMRMTVKPEYWPLVDQMISHGLIMVPLRDQGRSVGVLILARHRADAPAYDQEDLKFATALAERAALAIVNTGLYQALGEANADLERRVAERTAQLEAANKELESFSYSVAHDLRAPLRAMDGFSKLIADEFAPQLPTEAQRYTQVIRENAQQMGRLIDDLLALSRLGRKPLNKQTVKTTDLAQQVAHDVEQGSGRPVRIFVGDLPDCEADPALLRQVFVNLLSNAVKFTRTQENPRIEVLCQTNGHEHTYCVKDNGVGFDMQYAGKLFGVFQRLHRAEDYEGTGVGLAITQRIIHRHGGRVWAEAEENKGATFYFTLGGTTDGSESDRNSTG